MLDKNTVKLEVVDATREVVDRLLSMNVNNRPLSKSHVNKLRRNISGGQWVYNLEVIQVLTDRNGNWKQLVSGQHRLHAIKDEGYPKGIVLNVISGYDENGMSDLAVGTDVVKVRRGQDILSIIGAHNTAQVSAAINAYARNILGISNYSVSEVALFYRAHEDLFGKGWAWVEQHLDGIRPSAGFYGAVLADVMTGHTDAIDLYKRALSKTGWTEDDLKNNPLYRLQEVIQQTFRIPGGRSIGMMDCFFIVTRKCFDYYRRCKSMPSSLKVRGLNGILKEGAITKEDARKYTSRPDWDPSNVKDVYPIKKKEDEESVR